MRKPLTEGKYKSQIKGDTGPIRASAPPPPPRPNKKTLTLTDYNAYMRVIQYYLDETENMLKQYDRRKKVSSLTFEQWAEWQNGKISLDDIKNQ
jgi:hypothetical protein